jgi:hypothetical protein
MGTKWVAIDWLARALSEHTHTSLQRHDAMANANNAQGILLGKLLLPGTIERHFL